MYFGKTYYSENGKPSELEIICNKCGKTILVKDLQLFQTIQSDYCVVIDNKKIQCECGNEGCGFIEYKNNPTIEQTIVKKVSTVVNQPKCPTCQSTNISKIGTLNRMASVGLFGLASSKIGKTHKCNSCGSTW